MSKKDIIPLINLYLDIYPEISDHIDLTNLEEKSNNELSEINKECLFLISGYGNEKLRKKEIIFLLVLLCVLLEIKTVDNSKVINKLQSDFTSINGIMWYDQILDDVISLYEMDSNKQNIMIEYLNDIPRIDINKGISIVRYFYDLTSIVCDKKCLNNINPYQLLIYDSFIKSLFDEMNKNFNKALDKIDFTKVLMNTLFKTNV